MMVQNIFNAPKGERQFHIRDLKPEDAHAIFPLLADEENGRFMAFIPPKNAEDVRQSFENHIAVGYYYAITANDEDKAIGFVGVDKDGADQKIGKIGYLLNKQYWGSGIAPAAVKLITEYVLKNTEIEQIYATIKTDNKNSQRCIEKAGYLLKKKEENYVSSAAADQNHVRLIYYSA